MAEKPIDPRPMATRSRASASNSCDEKRKTVAQFGGCGFVSRRGAADGGGDEAVAQFETVVAVDRSRLRRETGSVERRIKEITRCVAGKRPAGAVAAMGARREPDDDRARVGVTEGGDGTTPVGAGEVGALLFGRNVRGVCPQLGAPLAADHRTLDGGQ